MGSLTSYPFPANKVMETVILALVLSGFGAASSLPSSPAATAVTASFKDLAKPNESYDVMGKVLYVTLGKDQVALGVNRYTLEGALQMLPILIADNHVRCVHVITTEGASLGDLSAVESLLGGNQIEAVYLNHVTETPARGMPLTGFITFTEGRLTDLENPDLELAE